MKFVLYLYAGDTNRIKNRKSYDYRQCSDVHPIIALHLIRPTHFLDEFSFEYPTAFRVWKLVVSTLKEFFHIVFRISGRITN